MRMRDRLHAATAAALHGAGVDPQSVEFTVERPRVASHGDWSTNAALVAAGAADCAPRQLAERITERLCADPPPHVEAVEIAGPGFVNFRLAPRWLHEVLADVVTAGVDGYGVQRPRQRADGERRVRVGQPDRTAARRPRGAGLRTATRCAGCWSAAATRCCESST